MLIPSLVAVIRFEYTGVNIFTVPFPFYTLQSIQVATQSRDARDGIDLIFGTDYTVTGIPAELGDSPVAFTSGTVTLTATGIAKVAARGLIAIFRITEQSQLYKYSELDPFPAKSHENALGRNTAMIQELQQQVDRAIKMDVTYEGTPQSGDDLLADVNAIADRAEAAVTNAEAAVVKAETAATNAENSAAQAKAIRDQLFDLSIVTVSIPFGQPGVGTYDPNTGILTLQVPKGEQGTQGIQGIEGPIGPIGPPGTITGELDTIAFGNFRIDTDGILQFEYIGTAGTPTAVINQSTGQIEITL